MLSLPFRKITLDCPELRPYSEAFATPIACYARHRLDKEYVLPMAMEFDFSQGKITCFDPFSESNRNALAKIEWNPFFIGLDRIFDPHWFIRLNDGTYLMFFQRKRRYFYRFRPEESRFDAVFPEDIGLPPEVDEFWATNLLHSDGSVTFLVHETYTNRSCYSIYRSNPEFDRFELVHSGYTKSRNIPHVIVKYKKGYLLSDFYYNEFQFAGDPLKRRLSEEDVLAIIYSKLFSEFTKGRTDSPVFSDFCKKSPRWTVPVGDFADYVRKILADTDCRSIKEYCDGTAFRFNPLPGEITYIDPEGGVEAVFETTCSNPAHFEVDSKTGEVYVSSHNFNHLNRNILEYFWPAAIDRFVPDSESVLRKTGTFSVPDGYRFTSHRIVHSNKGKKIVTFGQPNRFFSISAPEFESVLRLDVMPNRLSELADNPLSILRYLQRDGGDESVTIKALEASEDGSWTVLAVSSDSAFFIDSNTENRKDIGYSRFSLPFPPDWAGNSEKGVFVCRTSHLNYVR